MPIDKQQREPHHRAGCLSLKMGSEGNEKDEMKRWLHVEIDAYASKSYEELMQMDEYTYYDKGTGQSWYQVSVTVLEKTEEYVHVGVAVDDGRWRAFFPLSSSFIIYKDGRAQK